MIPSLPERLAHKATAAFLSFALVLTAPGLGSYQAVAAQLRPAPSKVHARLKIQLGVGTIPSVRIPATAARQASVGLPKIPARAALQFSGRPAQAARQRFLGRLTYAADAVAGFLNSKTPDSSLKAAAAEPFENSPRSDAGDAVAAQPRQSALSSGVLKSASVVRPVPPQPPAPPSEGPPTGGSGGSGGGEAGPLANGVEIHENALGFRKVVGRAYDDPPSTLSFKASGADIIADLAKRLRLSRDEVLTVAAQVGITEASPAQTWWGLHDRLLGAHRESFSVYDHKKSEWGAYRQLANMKYEPGAAGALSRAAELHKHLVGFFVRFPYHLFDMFFFGYFRKNISFEYFHSNEDFLGYTPEQAKQWLEKAVRDQARDGSGLLGDLTGTPFGRALRHYVGIPLLGPLGTFILRRLNLAILSAVAMGLLGAAAPFLPFLSLHLAAIPYLGDLLDAALHGLPVAVKWVPFLGDFLAPVVAEAVDALFKDLVVGPLLNTGILSSLLTFPHAYREQLLKLRSADPGADMTLAKRLRAAGRASLSASFWKQNGKSFLSMATVGSEIAGILKYTAGADALVDPAWKAATGADFHLFHAVASAVESPEGESVIPFGGAITWGNAIFYNLQNAVGFNLSDSVMHALNPGTAPMSASALVQAASHGGEAYYFDKDLHRRPSSEISERLKELASVDGGLGKEKAAVRKHRAHLSGDLAMLDGKLARLLRESKLVPPEQKARYERLTKDLGAKREQSYAHSKLAEGHDLKNPAPENLPSLQKLRELQKEYEGSLAPASQYRPGFWEDLGVKEASLKALARNFAAAADKESRADDLTASEKAELRTKAGKIEELVRRVKAQREEVNAQLAMRDAVAQLLAAANNARNEALRQQRSGKERRALQEEFAQLATVVDISLGLKEYDAAVAQLHRALGILGGKLDKIKAARVRNEKDLSGANAQLGLIDEFREDARKEDESDASRKSDMAKLHGDTALAAERITSFKSSLPALISQINAADKGDSPDAGAEYQRRLDMLQDGTVVGWLTEGGNPNDPDAINLKDLKADLAEVKDNINKAREGIADIQARGFEEGAGVILIKAPGPEVAYVPDPDPAKRDAQILGILSDRRAHWTEKLAELDKSYDSVLRRLGETDTKGRAPGTAKDEYGDVHPESLPERRALNEGRLGASRSAAQDLTAQINALADQINTVIPAAAIPALSTADLTELQEAIKTYGDKIKAVQIPDDQDSKFVKAQLNILAIGELVPRLGREVIQWSKADATVAAIDKALGPVAEEPLSNVLPLAKQRLGAARQMFQEILADVTLDENFVKAGYPATENNALIERKTALLGEKIIPRLEGLEGLLADTLIPFQDKSIAAARFDPAQDYYKLFDAQKTLWDKTNELYKKTAPWALASHGAKENDAADGRRRIDSWKARLEKEIQGDPALSGPRGRGLESYLAEVKNRRDPDYAGAETDAVLMDATQPDGKGPLSLPRKIALYQAERIQRAAQFNEQAATVNKIIAKIEALSSGGKGNYDLSGYRLPENVTGDAAGAAVIQRLVDEKILSNLGDRLKEIGNEAKAKVGDVDLGGTDAEGVLTGNQPPVDLPDEAKIALLAMYGGTRLVPSSQIKPGSAAASYATVRMLYADGVIEASEKALGPGGQVAVAEDFLTRGKAAIQAAIDLTAKDYAYVDSNGASEPPQEVYDRNAASFASLRDFLGGGESFFDQKHQWHIDTLETIDKIQEFWEAQRDLHDGGLTVGDTEVEAWQKMHDAISKTLRDIEPKRAEFASWLAQLNDPRNSAMSRVSEKISDIMDNTRKVLETNISFRDLEDQVKGSNALLEAAMGRADSTQEELKNLLDSDPGAMKNLPPALLERVDALKLRRGMWELPSGSETSAAEAIVVRKTHLSAFVDTVLGMFQHHKSTLDLNLLKQELLANPQGLAGLIPESSVLQFGDDADGFYLVYQSKFSVPHGLETSSWVTVGNIASLWNNNLSVTGYQVASPPNESNAPWGDKGVMVSIESLPNAPFVNYLDVDFHRLALDIPADTAIATQARQSRIMIFENFAMMLFGDRLYVGLAGLSDTAVHKSADKPQYYGGNLKSSLKLAEVMRLNAEQQEMFVKDPRSFMKDINLDFTGFDEDLNELLRIGAKADNRRRSKTQLGPSLDVGRLLKSLNWSDSNETFTLDMYYSRVSGTDDLSQKALGGAVVKGFTLKDNSGKPWALLKNRTGAELGQKYDTFTDKLAIELPNYGVVLSGEGKLIGGATTLYGELAKKFGANTWASVGYGSQYAGMNDRLTITGNTSFTLGELWRSVVDRSRENLAGGETLKGFHKDLDAFFEDEAARKGPSAPKVAALKQVYTQDVARRLITQDMGVLTKEISELRKAGALFDNARITGFLGFTSNPVSNDLTERVVSGGPMVGTRSEIKLSKTQKDLINSKAATLYREGLRLQTRMLELTKQWQGSVLDLAQAQWDLRLAEFMVRGAPAGPARAEAGVRKASAESRLHQALLNYNHISGRGYTEPGPFENLSQADLQALLVEIRKTLEAPDRVLELLHSLDAAELKSRLGEDPKNPMNLPLLNWVDHLTVGVGVQLHHLMSGQIFDIGGSVSLPVWDPGSKNRNNAYVLQDKAVYQEMRQAYAENRLGVELDRRSAEIWKANAEAMRPALPEAAAGLSAAIPAYRNGLIGPERLESAFKSWHWYASSLLDAEGKAAVAAAGSAAAGGFRDPEGAAPSEPARVSSIEEAFALVSQRSHSLAEVALRQQAASELAQAENHRIQKATVDLRLGLDLTASGAGWLPSVGVTGIGLTPILGFEFKSEELRELQVAGKEGETRYYEALKDKLESGLALQFYQAAAAYAAAKERAKEFDEKLLPILEGELADAKRRAASGGSQTAVLEASKVLDETRGRRASALAARDRSLATANYLLGRDPAARLDLELDPKAALASLRRLLSAKKPVEAQRRLLDARVEVARAYETIAGKDIKIEQVVFEPVSLAARSFGRLLRAIKDSDIGNPDAVAQARDRTRTEERARDSFDKNRDVEIARAKAELSLVRAKLRELREKQPAGPSDESRRRLLEAELEGRKHALKAELLGLGRDPDGEGEAAHEAVPASFEELKNRLAQKEGRLAVRPSEAAIEAEAPGTLTHPAASYMRLYHARTTLGGESIGKNFRESWIEVRLKSHDTPEDVQFKLATLRDQRADHLHQTALAGAASRANILASDFEANVRMLRGAQEEARRPEGSFRGHLDEYIRGLRQKLQVQGAEIAAVLDLNPQTEWETLAALVPRDPTGSHDVKAMALRFVEQVKASQIDALRRTLFESGLPPSFGREDNQISQVRADLIAQRMSYKGFTPVAAYGAFRGTGVGGGFFEAPDPRAIERGLENVLSDVLRQELKSSGRLRDLAMRMHSLMSKVEDGARLLEEKGKLVEAAEADYLARLGRLTDPAELKAADAQGRARIVSAWLSFAEQMVETKSDFISLVSELEALGQRKKIAREGLGAAPEPRAWDSEYARRDPRAEFLAHWTGRFLDRDFSSRFEARLEGLGPKAPAELKERIARRAMAYRIAKRDAEAVLVNDFAPAEKLELLTQNDLEGKRQALEAELAALLAALKVLSDPAASPSSNPEWAALLSFLSEDIEASAREQGLARSRYAEAAKGLRESYWDAVSAPRAVDGAFARLENLKRELEARRQDLLESYLSDASRKPSHILLKDELLDRYLKSEQAFDAEVIKTFRSDAVRRDPGLKWALDGLYGIRATLNRAVDASKSGRGMLALDALIMLEESRLAAARWGARPPREIDQAAAALQSLRATRQRWQAGSDDLTPLYAVTKVTKDGKRLWSVERWLTAEELKGLEKKIRRESGRVFIGEGVDEMEILGGVDSRESDLEQADAAVKHNGAELSLHQRMKEHDFAVDGGDDKAGYSYEEVFGAAGLSAQGRLHFFEASKEGEKAGLLHKALHPLAALRLPPDQYVLYVYDGQAPVPGRGRYPTLESLLSDKEAGHFHRLAVSEKGAETMARRAQERRVESLRRGWLEVKLNSFGFARDEKGRPAKLYQSEEEFNSELKALLNAEENLKRAEEASSKAAVKEAGLAEERAERAEAFREARLAYQRVEDAARAALMAKPSRELADELVRRRGESDKAYLGRAKLALDKAVSQDKAVKSAHKRLEPVSKKNTEASQKHAVAKAQKENAERDLEKAKEILARAGKDKDRPQAQWSLHRSRDLALELDGEGAVVLVEAAPVFGERDLKEKLGSGAGRVTRVEGEIFQASVDERSRVRKIVQDEKAFREAARGFVLKSVAMQGQDDTPVSDDGRKIRTNYRRSHYEDHSVLGPDGKPQPLLVLLNRDFLLREKKQARWELGKAKHAWIMPENLGSLLLALPRSIAGTPVELLTGRDLRGENYMGEIRGLQTYGTASNHQGLIRRAADFIDVLDFLPEPIDPILDPSQFPDEVVLKSPALPGRILYGKTLRDADSGRDIELGVKSIRRDLSYIDEDLASAGQRTLSRFRGGVEETFISSIRGRGRLTEGGLKTLEALRGVKGPSQFYEESSRRARIESKDGRHADALEEALDLEENPLVANDPRSDGSGAVIVSAAPRAAAVELVEQQVRVTVGADQFSDQAEATRGYDKRLAERFEKLKAEAPRAAKALEDAKRGYQEAVVERESSADEAGRAWDGTHRASWPIGAQESVERGIKRVRGESAELSRRMAWWKDYQARLESARPAPRPHPGPKPGPKPAPEPKPKPDLPSPPAWPGIAFALAALAAALWHWLRRRRP